MYNRDALSICLLSISLIVGASLFQVCYVHNLGIGVHPLRREEMVRAALISKGRASP